MGSTKLLSCKQMESELLDGVKDLWKNSLFLDFTLKVEDEAIPVHKVVLAACSGYFRAMFNSSMRESSQRSVELMSLTASAVKSVIKFIYTGDIELSEDNFEDVLSAAHYLQIPLAVSLCCDYLLDDMTWDSVCHVQHLAQMYALKDVEGQVKNFMLTFFSEMPDEAVESVGKQILKLVASNALCVNSEYELFEKLLLFKTILLADEFHKALSLVRFPLMSKAELEKVSSTGVMTTRLSHLMNEAWEYHKDVMRQPLLQTERTQVRSDKVTMVVAYMNCITGVYEDQLPKDILTSEHRDTLQDLGVLDIKQVVVLDNFLYICENIDDVDADDYLIGFYRYDPRFDLWQELEPLLERGKTKFPLVACGKQIFAIGGFTSRSMEIYDIQTNQWQYGIDINYYNCVSAGTSLGNKIYVCGGKIYDDQNETVEDTLSCYDPTEETWQLKAPMIAARSDHHIAVVDEKIYVFGGVSNDQFPFDVEYYSPNVDQWTVIHDAMSDVIDGLCADGSDVYILTRDDVVTRNNEFMKVLFQKFNFETGSTEEGFTIEMPYLIYDQSSWEELSPYRPYTCSTLTIAST